MLKKNCSFEATSLDGVLEFRLSGEIDHHSAVMVRTEMDAEIQRQRPSKTVMDLSGIEFMDSSGLGLIMGRYALMQRQGGTLTVRNPNERIIRILEMAGFGRVISIEVDERSKKETRK